MYLIFITLLNLNIAILSPRSNFFYRVFKKLFEAIFIVEIWSKYCNKISSKLPMFWCMWTFKVVFITLVLVSFEHLFGPFFSPYIYLCVFKLFLVEPSIYFLIFFVRSRLGRKIYMYVFHVLSTKKKIIFEFFELRPIEFKLNHTLFSFSISKINSVFKFTSIELPIWSSNQWILIYLMLKYFVINIIKSKIFELVE